MKPLHRPFNALVSYVYAERKVALMRSTAAAGVRYIADSGAFTAMTKGQPISVSGYLSWLGEVGGFVDWAASLDVIGDPARSWTNYRQLLDAGCVIVPTVHWGTPVAELDRYVDAGADLIGLGGIAKRYKDPTITRWLVAAFRRVRDNYPHVRFHGWGDAHREHLLTFPFWSVDSSSFSQSYRFARLVVYDDNTGRQTHYRLDGKGALATHGQLLRNRFGVTPAEIARATRDNTDLLYQVSGHIAQDFERFYRRRGLVAPPPSLSHLGDGLRVHYANSDFKPFLSVARNLTLSEAP